MSGLIANIKREPVRWLAGLQVLWIAVIGFLLVFEFWHPTADQLQWTLGVPLVIANAFGFKVVRDSVTPNAKLPKEVEDAAEQDRPIIPVTVRDVGMSTVGLVVLIVVVIFAFFGAAHIFGWNLG